VLLTVGVSHVPDDAPLLAGWLGMVGCVLALHFGLFHVLSCLWRSAGLGAVPLMDWPIAARSVSEFWGRRWNRAFRDLAHRLAFRPLEPLVGAWGALAAGFLASGLIHELVISVPAEGGYGGPTGYFLLQAAGIAAERSRIGRRLGLRQGLAGRLFAAAVVVGPLGLLFHRPFVLNVFVPFLQALGVWP
jgi:alginate O-acetyltransferase complex protein AlgI